MPNMQNPYTLNFKYCMIDYIVYKIIIIIYNQCNGKIILCNIHLLGGVSGAGVVTEKVNYIDYEGNHTKKVNQLIWHATHIA